MKILSAYSTRFHNLTPLKLLLYVIIRRQFIPNEKTMISWQAAKTPQEAKGEYQQSSANRILRDGLDKVALLHTVPRQQIQWTDENIKAKQGHSKKKTDEEAMIPEADAVTDPGTV